MSLLLNYAKHEKAPRGEVGVSGDKTYSVQIDPNYKITIDGEKLCKLKDLTDDMEGEHVDCPHVEDHKAEDRYARVLKLSGGDMGIQCGGDRCRNSDKKSAIYVPKVKKKDPASVFKKEKKKSKIKVIPYNKLHGEKPQSMTLFGLPVPKEAMIMLAGKGDTAKSTLAIAMTIDYLKQNPDKKALMWFTEDGENIVRSRVDYFKASDDVKNRMMFVRANVHEVRSEAVDTIIKLSKNYGMTVLDPMISFFDGEENSNSDARDFFNRAKLIKGLVVVIHHSSKGGETARGASDFRNAMRMVYKVELFTQTYRQGHSKWTVDDPRFIHARFVSVDKDNHGYSQNRKFDGMNSESSGYIIELFDTDLDRMRQLHEKKKTILDTLTSDKDGNKPKAEPNVLIFGDKRVDKFKAEDAISA